MQTAVTVVNLIHDTAAAQQREARWEADKARRQRR